MGQIRLYTELVEERQAGNWLSLGHVLALGVQGALMGPEPLKRLKDALNRGRPKGLDELGRRLKDLYGQMRTSKGTS